MAEDLASLLAPNSDQESDVDLQDEILSSDSESESDSSISDSEHAGAESFPQLDSSDEDGEEGPAAIKAMTAVKRSGASFAAMGLSRLLLTNIQRKGFKTPTPIQRKTMPDILDGKDIVGMARTGSGKTAAFVVPMVEKLRSHSARAGARALILSPSRELALQTLKVIREFSRKTELRTILLVGGDSLEDQFKMMMSNPDIIVATPGRFTHLKAEMKLKLETMEYIVFDEADRLFEMGFSEQLDDILASLPDTRQTLLFSATLPPTLVEFAKAGLHNPILARLDAEQKISDQLQMAFFGVNDNERDGALLYLLQNVVKLPLMSSEQRAYLTKRDAYDPTEGVTTRREREATGNELPSAQATIVFVPTKHHVEYVANLLKAEGYAVSYIYGSLDQAARREQLYLFRAGKTSCLVVTDVAARGVDIPMLANVINYNTPTNARIFVHRVGRTARAGNTGWAYTLVRQSDLPYLADLEVFLGRPLTQDARDYTGKLVLGALPRVGLEFDEEQLAALLDRDYDLDELRKVANRGEKLWLKSREAASKQGVKRAREWIQSGAWERVHSLLVTPEQNAEEAKDAFLSRLANRKSKETVFEINGVGKAAQIMARRREQVAPVQERQRKLLAEREREREFKESQTRDEEYMSHYESTETLQERGYAINGTAGFADAARGASMSLGGEGTEIGQSKQFTTRWDRKRGKYINQSSENTTKYVRGENGVRVPASLSTGRFEAWKNTHKLGNTSSINADEQHRRYKHNSLKAPKSADKARDDYKQRRGREEQHASSKPARDSGLRTSAQIQKERAAKQQRWTKSNQPSKQRKRRF